jgi:hypothetical protein
VEIPAGQAVEDVELVERGIPTTQTGLHLPMVPIAIPACDCQPETYSGPVEDWYPNQIFDWEVLHNPDGSSTLAISTFPFQYNPLTAVSRFYPGYIFEISTQSTGVQITGLATDKPSYNLEDPIQIEIEVNNLGEAQDVIVRALIKQAGSEDEIAGLNMTVLDGLVGPAGITLEWDSTGIDPGTYQVQVALQPIGDEWTVSLETQRFDLGIVNETDSYKIFLPLIQK